MAGLFKVPLNASASSWSMSRSSQLGVIRKLAEGALYPIIQVINEVLKRNWP